MDLGIPLLPTDDDNKECQNCYHSELQHDILDGAYYKCRICGKFCSGKFYQTEPDE